MEAIKPNKALNEIEFANSSLHRGGQAGVNLAGAGHFLDVADRYAVPPYASDILAAAAPLLNAPETMKEIANEYAATHVARNKIFSKVRPPDLRFMADIDELARRERQLALQPLSPLTRIALQPVPQLWQLRHPGQIDGQPQARVPAYSERPISVRNPFRASDGGLAGHAGFDAQLDAALDTYKYPVLSYSQAAVEANTAARLARDRTGRSRARLNWRPAPQPSPIPQPSPASVLKRGSAGAGPDWLGRPWWAVFGR
jgi:hypothetical protein